MVPFNLEIDLGNNSESLLAEQLERLADDDGFIGFDVTCGERRSVIHVNMERDLPLATPQDAETYFEQVHYPEQVNAFSEEDIFSHDEVQIIGKAIQNYNRELKLQFNRFMSRP
jgi:hypothetical protein